MKPSTGTALLLRRTLLGLCVLFLVLVVTEINLQPVLHSANAIEQAGRAAHDLDAEKATLETENQLAHYDVISARPLFAEDRLPLKGIAEAMPSQAEQRNTPPGKTANPDFILSAVVITNGKRIALVQKQKNKEIVKLQEGEQLNGWLVSAIEADNVSLIRGGEAMILELLVGLSPRQAVNAAPERIENQPPEPDMTGPPVHESPTGGDGPPIDN